jgi:FdhD protein
VHGCALFQGEKMLTFVEDVGRHNAIDTIAGWMWLQSEASTPGTDVSSLPPEGALAPRGSPPSLVASPPMTGTDKVFYTTGRLTSEMVIKSAQMGVPIVVSRSGITQMGYDVAKRVGLCTIGRATNKHFLCYTGVERLQLQPELAGVKLRAVA